MREISVAARSSPLSQAQVLEVLEELHQHHPNISFKVHSVKAYGDLDRTTSLRSLGKTDFFTREIDALVISGQCKIAIHSAKDLPDAIPDGLQIVAITRGLDASDSLVMKEGSELFPNMLIATSSERREEAVRHLVSNVRFIDIRGTIGERLEKLQQNEVDGVVIAEAALIRLKLTHLYRVQLPGNTVPLQGQLAIVAHARDIEMLELFSKMDARNR